MTPRFQEFLKRLQRLNKRRSEPSDFIYNLAEISNELQFSDNEWVNFYQYVTLQNKDDFKWVKEGEIKTLGDLPIEELEQLNKELTQDNVDFRQNGFETNMLIKNMENLEVIKTNGKKRMARTLVKNAKSKPKDVSKAGDGCRVENV